MANIDGQPQLTVVLTSSLDQINMLEGSKSRLAKIDVFTLSSIGCSFLLLLYIFNYDLFTSVLLPNVPIAHRNCSRHT